MKRLFSGPWAAGAVLFVGSLQILGWALELPAIQRVGQATAASPLPLVFSLHRGWESFSPRFAIDLRFADGSMEHVPIDPAAYSRLPGPYNRRNVFGAVLAFGPLLDEGNRRAMRDAVLRYALCNDGPLARLSSRPGEVVGAIVTAAPRARGGGEVWTENVDCPSPR
jgi:hypothetical protein